MLFYKCALGITNTSLLFFFSKAPSAAHLMKYMTRFMEQFRQLVQADRSALKIQVLYRARLIKFLYKNIKAASVLENFVWLRKDTKSGTVNLTIFQAPLTRDKLNMQKVISGNIKESNI